MDENKVYGAACGASKIRTDWRALERDGLSIGDRIKVDWRDYDDEGSWQWYIFKGFARFGRIMFLQTCQNMDTGEMPCGASIVVSTECIDIICRISENEKMGADVTSRVMRDLELRRETGVKKYGAPLVSGVGCNNAKSNLQNLYEELLDAACYIKKQIMEDSCKL